MMALCTLGYDVAKATIDKYMPLHHVYRNNH
jgi:hypothetical protein